jgi:hypothetical protein
MSPNRLVHGLQAANWRMGGIWDVEGSHCANAVGWLARHLRHVVVFNRSGEVADGQGVPALRMLRLVTCTQWLGALRTQGPFAAQGASWQLALVTAFRHNPGSRVRMGTGALRAGLLSPQVQVNHSLSDARNHVAACCFSDTCDMQQRRRALCS